MSSIKFLRKKECPRHDMIEKCKVKKVKGGFAYIELKKSEKCGGCKACHFSDDGVLTMPSIMDVKCETGDTVIVEMPQAQYILAPFLLFGVPLLLFLVGLIAGSWAGEIFMVLFAFAFFAVGLIGAFFADRLIRTNRKYMPVVIDKILEIEYEIKEEIK